MEITGFLDSAELMQKHSASRVLFHLEQISVMIIQSPDKAATNFTSENVTIRNACVRNSYPGPPALLVRSDHHLNIRIYNTLDFTASVDKLLQFDDRPEHDLA